MEDAAPIRKARSSHLRSKTDVTSGKSMAFFSPRNSPQIRAPAEGVRLHQAVCVKW